MSYPLTVIDGIDEDVAKVLKGVGIRSAGALLERAKNPQGRKALAASTGFDERLLLEWANIADGMRIKGVGREYAILMREAGVKTVRDLKHRNAGKLVAIMREINAARPRVKFPPSEKAVVKWIAQANRLPLKISY